MECGAITMARPEKCKNCKKPCTIHHTIITDGDIQQIDMCQDCPEQQQIPAHTSSTSIGNLLAVVDQVLKGGKSETQDKSTKVQVPTCDQCGMTLSTLRSKGRFGCMKCYEAFAPSMGDVFYKIHRANEHIGKRPLTIPELNKDEIKKNKDEEEKVAKDEIRRKDLIDRTNAIRAEAKRLEREMDKAVTQENYEEASVLRDRIAERKTLLQQTTPNGELEYDQSPDNQLPDKGS